MNIQLGKAVSVFFGSPSFDDVYVEAVANAIDAGATKISICIEIESFKSPKNLKIQIRDNGIGFCDRNFSKFSTLLDVENSSHKGVGRLVYLAYFDKVEIDSVYNGSLRRKFNFDKNFDAKDCAPPEQVKRQKNGTLLTFTNFIGKQLNKYANIQHEEVLNLIVSRFLSLLYELKRKRKHLEILVQTKVAKEGNRIQSGITKWEISELPKLSWKEVKIPGFDLLEKVKLFYSIKEAETKFASCNICVDGRSMNYDLITADSLPAKYDARFLITSKILKINTDSSRQRLEFPPDFSEDTFKYYIKQAIYRILIEKIPTIVEKNDEVYASFDKEYPHLYGLYDKNETVGLVNKQTMMERAQQNLIRRQGGILGKFDLSNEKYEEALQLASRALMEYILYRSYIIQKLKEIDKNKSEPAIHSIISPRYRTYSDNTLKSDLFNNNVWLLDDKFVSYDYTLSDKEMKELFKKLDKNYKETGSEIEIERPDIALVFSADPNASEQVDIVIVELKRYGINIYNQNAIIEQLKERARNLIDYYKVGLVNRMWYFGILEINDKLLHSIDEAQYKHVFSRGQVYYKQELVISNRDNGYRCDIDVYLMDYETVVSDAEARNSTFISVLRRRIQDFVKQHKGN